MQLTKTLGLAYGAIDMIVTPDGEYVFLEINPTGQYQWLEALTGLRISGANWPAALSSTQPCWSTSSSILSSSQRTGRPASPISGGRSTAIRTTADRLRFLFWHGVRWCWFCYWLDFRWHSCGPAAVLDMDAAGDSAHILA